MGPVLDPWPEEGGDFGGIHLPSGLVGEDGHEGLHVEGARSNVQGGELAHDGAGRHGDAHLLGELPKRGRQGLPGVHGLGFAPRNRDLAPVDAAVRRSLHQHRPPIPRSVGLQTWKQGQQHRRAPHLHTPCLGFLPGLPNHGHGPVPPLPDGNPKHSVKPVPPGGGLRVAQFKHCPQISRKIARITPGDV